MILDNHADEAGSQTKISADFDSQSELYERNQLLGKDNLVGTMLGDRTIIKRFALGKKRLVLNQNLRIEYTHNSLQLSTPSGELIAIHKINDRLTYILIKKDSEYLEKIHKIIVEYQFIPLDTSNAERGFIRYQKHEIPDGYLLQYEPGDRLWQTWIEDRQQDPNEPRLDILILARSKWYRVQEMLCIDNRLDLQTRLGLISLPLRDPIAWISKRGIIPGMINANLTLHQQGNNIGGDGEILGKIISKLAIETNPDSDLDFNSSTTMSTSLLGKQQDLSHLDEADRNGIIPVNPLTQMEEELRSAAIAVLEKYLEHGETIIRTEAITDPQGNIISEKTVTIHRGCPKWAIDAVIRWG
jgi:hypothetical protein